MLKKLTYICVILYLTVIYIQNLMPFGSDVRIDFYFIGMSIVNSLIAYLLFKSFKNIATSFYLFMCIGSVFNQVIYNGDLSYIEVVAGVLGVIYILFENKIKKLWIFKK